MNKKRVFVSSVIKGYESIRTAARAAIIEAGGEPILINEDFPSLDSSPRNVCIDAIDSCDIFILLIGARAGFVAPSGKLVIEEEYERAKLKKIPSYVFIERTKHDDTALKLITRLSDFISGHFRREFVDETDLRTEIIRSIASSLNTGLRSNMIANIELLDTKNPHKILSEAMMRFGLVPEIEEEVVDAIKFDDKDFLNRLFDIGHSRKINLFDYERAKKISQKENSIVIYQESSNFNEAIKDVRFELFTSGKILIDQNITGGALRAGDIQSHTINMFLIAEEEVEKAIRTVFLCMNAIYDILDPFTRYTRFLNNFLFSEIGNRKLERNPQPQRGYSVGWEKKDLFIIYEQPRIIDRNDLKQPEQEIQNVLSKLKRKMSL